MHSITTVSYTHLDVYKRQEEYKARRAVELFDVIGEEGTGRWQIDKHVGQIVYESEA